MAVSTTMHSITINTWQSKNYCSETNCEAEQRKLDQFVEVIVKPFAKTLFTALVTNPAALSFRLASKHFCGAEPRYLTFILEEGGQTPLDKRFTIAGGEKWETTVIIEYDPSTVLTTPTVNSIKINYDSCWDPIDTLEIIASLVQEPLQFIEARYYYRDRRPSQIDNPTTKLTLEPFHDPTLKKKDNIEEAFWSNRPTQAPRYQAIKTQITGLNIRLYDRVTPKMLITSATHKASQHLTYYTAVVWVELADAFLPVLAGGTEETVIPIPEDLQEKLAQFDIRKYKTFYYRYHQNASPTGLEMLAMKHAEAYNQQRNSQQNE